MSRRITEHPILEYERYRGKKIHIIVNGERIKAYKDEPIAAALLAAGIKVFRKTPKLKRPRGIFCAIGRCTDCVMTVNGIPSVRTCITPSQDGMIVASQDA
ncbi:MAG TPA: (2Fe-2S)-binding protein [bacterium]|nr:(2Fe-2S)-binding protein [bacterium]